MSMIKKIGAKMIPANASECCMSLSLSASESVFCEVRLLEGYYSV